MGMHGWRGEFEMKPPDMAWDVLHVMNTWRCIVLFRLHATNFKYVHTKFKSLFP